MLRHSRPGMRGILARPLHNGRRHLNVLATVRTVIAGLVRLHPPEVRRRGNHRPLRAAVHGRDAARAFATDRLIGPAELAERVATIVHLPGPEKAGAMTPGARWRRGALEEDHPILPVPLGRCVDR